jgi:hypothetical protein
MRLNGGFLVTDTGASRGKGVVPLSISDSQIQGVRSKRLLLASFSPKPTQAPDTNETEKVEAE